MGRICLDQTRIEVKFLSKASRDLSDKAITNHEAMLVFDAWNECFFMKLECKVGVYLKLLHTYVINALTDHETMLVFDTQIEYFLMKVELKLGVC